MLKEGFSQWNKRDFFKFIQMAEIYGRKNCDMYFELIGFGKTVEQIQEYADAFWKNYKQVKNW